MHHFLIISEILLLLIVFNFCRLKTFHFKKVKRKTALIVTWKPSLACLIWSHYETVSLDTKVVKLSTRNPPQGIKKNILIQLQVCIFFFFLSQFVYVCFMLVTFGAATKDNELIVLFIIVLFRNSQSPS